MKSMKWIKNGVFVFLLIFFGTSLIRMALDYRTNKHFFNRTQNAFIQAEEKHKKLQSSYAMTSDMYEFEKNIRNKLNFHKPDEIIVMIPDPSPTPTKAPEKNYQPYRQWVDLFFSN